MVLAGDHMLCNLPCLQRFIDLLRQKQVESISRNRFGNSGCRVLRMLVQVRTVGNHLQAAADVFASMS